jgi:hypothetical protein
MKDERKKLTIYLGMFYMYDKRNEIVHGGEDTTLEAINLVSELVPGLVCTKVILSTDFNLRYESMGTYRGIFL